MTHRACHFENSTARAIEMKMFGVHLTTDTINRIEYDASTSRWMLYSA